MSKATVRQDDFTQMFVVKIAFFNSLMFFLVVACDTFTSRLHPAGPGQLIKTNLGSWILPAVVLVFFANCLLLLRPRHPLSRIILPCAVTGACGLVVSMTQFGSPAYHLEQILAFTLFPAPGLIATLIRSSPIKTDLVCDHNVALSARLEWIKQNAGFWTTVAITGLVAFLGFIYFWFKYLCDVAAMTYDNKANEAAAHGTVGVQAAALILYVVLGPFYESLLKTRYVNSLLRELRTEESSA